jgi:hypothetical protein
MLDAWKDRPECRRVTSRPVGDDALRRASCPGDRAFEESPRRSGVAPLSEVSVYDLAILIDCSIAVGPSAIEAAVRLIYSPFLAYPPAVSVGSLQQSPHQ